VLLVLAAGVMAGREQRLFAKCALVSIATAAVVGVYFIVGLPEFPGTSIGQGLILFVAACVLGVVGPILVLRSR
jgi:hypothetical protein